MSMLKFFVIAITLLVNYFNPAIGKKYVKRLYRNFYPCNDFYTFVCSKWENVSEMIASGTEWNQFLEMEKDMHNSLKNLLNAPLAFNDDSKIEDKLRRFYKSCMDIKSRSREAVTNMHFLLKNIGGFPILGLKLQKNYRWEDALGTVIRYLDFNEIFFQLDIRKSIEHPRKNNIVLDHTAFGDTQNPFLNEGKNLSQYKDMITSTIKTIIDRVSPGHYNGDAIWIMINEMVEFEKQLAIITKAHPIETRDPLIYLSYRVNEVQELIGKQTDFTRLLRKVFNGIADIKEGTHVTLPGKEYVTKLGEILANTDEKTIANYIGWKVLQKFNETLALNEVCKTFNCLSEKCINTMLDMLNLPISFVYKKFHDINEKDVTMIYSILSNLKKAFKRSISDSDWIDDKSKFRGLKKIEGIKLQLFGPEDLININILPILSQMNIEDNFFDSFVLLSIMNAENKLKLINLDYNETQHWKNGATRPSPFYIQESNTIYIPIGSMDFPNYYKALRIFINYGALGTLIAREITKAFNLRGFKFDKDGKYYEWFNSKEEYLEKFWCFVNQYNAYSDPIKINQIENFETQEEILADYIGFHVGNEAYKEYLKTCTRGCKQRLYWNGQTYNSEQLFFMSYANSLCGFHRPRSEHGYYKMKGGISARPRVMGTLANNEDFLKAFNCPEDSAMYAKKKCKFF